MRICLIELVDGSNPALHLRSEFCHHHRQRIALHVKRHLVYHMVAILKITNDTLPRCPGHSTNNADLLLQHSLDCLDA